MYLRSNKVLLKTNSQRGSTTWEYWREQLLKFMVDKFVGNNTRLYHKWKQEDIMSIQKRPFLFPPPHFIKVIGSNNIGSKMPLLWFSTRQILREKGFHLAMKLRTDDGAKLATQNKWNQFIAHGEEIISQSNGSNEDRFDLV